MPARTKFDVLSRRPGDERVALRVNGELWNEFTGPAAVAIIEKLDEAQETKFDEREMKLIRAVFSGDVDATKLFEGGDYAYSTWNFGLSHEEMNAFLGKVG